MSRTDSDVRRLTSHLSEQTDRLSGIAMGTIYAVTFKFAMAKKCSLVYSGHTRTW